MDIDRAPEAGLSLTEVLVSLVILSLIGLASLSLLQSLARTSGQVTTRTDEMAQLNTAFSLIQTALLNAQPDTVSVADDQLNLTLDPSHGSTELTYSLGPDGLQRMAQRGGQTLTQRLTDWPVTGAWALSPGLVTLSLNLPNGSSGTRSFAAPGGGT